MSLLTQGQQVGDYTVEYLIKSNAYCETYRVADAGGEPYFLKLFIIKNMPQKLVASNGMVREIEYCRQLRHQHIISFITNGELTLEETGTCQYMVTVYFSGELLVERVQREGALPPDEAKRIACGVAEALQYMHGEHRLLHNDITPRNIMLSARTNGEPELIDMGHVSPPTSGVPPFDTSDLETEYSSTKSFSGMYDDDSDTYALVAVLYFMLTGHAPWTLPDGGTRADRVALIKRLRREEPLDTTAIADDHLRRVVAHGLANKAEDRFKNAAQLLHALNNPDSVDEPEPQPEPSMREQPAQRRGDSHKPTTDDPAAADVDIEVRRGKGNGFADIAGMESLKQMLTTRVIFVLRDPERAKRYRITPPNGILLYGPPGCGKTYFAEKFAEETGFNFMLVCQSDVGSSFLHGTQGRIAQLFKKAEQNTPIVMCFDEFDAFVPDRNNDFGNYRSEEVNAFLTHLNNCSQRGVFVVAMSNRPDKIDPAVLRTGRIDKRIFVPLPDRVARREIFRHHLANRPCDEIDFERLADMSDHYVASDIAYVANEVATIAAFNNVNISQTLLETAVSGHQPSVSADKIREYERIRDKMENAEKFDAGFHVGYT